MIKSEAEIDLMRKCGDITSEMFIESMRFSVQHVSGDKYQIYSPYFSVPKKNPIFRNFFPESGNILVTPGSTIVMHLSYVITLN